MDVHTSAQRSFNMSRIRSNNTKPELLLRKKLWQNRIRGYRLDRKLPGRPDLYFPKNKLAVFVDGCFWHKCKQCYIEPKSNKLFWVKKININIRRDKEVNKQLQQLGVNVLRLWEHELQNDINSCLLKIKILL